MSKLFQLGNHVINLDAVSHVEYNKYDNHEYCQIVFGDNPKPLGENVIAIWAVIQHISMNITPTKPDAEPTENKPE